MSRSPKTALKYICNPSTKILRLNSHKNWYTREKYNFICKAVARADWKLRIFNFKFYWNQKFNKLVHSMGSAKEISFEFSGFVFERDLQINEATRYTWTSVILRFWYFTANAFKNLINLLVHMAKSTEFLLKIDELTVITDDDSLRPFFEKLKIEYLNCNQNAIETKKCSLKSSLLEAAMSTLEKA